MANEEYHITCIIGDLLERHITVTNPSRDVIEKVRFTCSNILGPKKGIWSDLPYSEEEGVYFLRFDNATTSKFRPGTFIYNLTAILLDGNENTIIYQGLITAKPKELPCEYILEEEDAEKESEEEAKRRRRHKRRHKSKDTEEDAEEEDAD